MLYACSQVECCSFVHFLINKSILIFFLFFALRFVDIFILLKRSITIRVFLQSAYNDWMFRYYRNRISSSSNSGGRGSHDVHDDHGVHGVHDVQ